jgi:hypothetical protein
MSDASSRLSPPWLCATDGRRSPGLLQPASVHLVSSTSVVRTLGPSIESRRGQWRLSSVSSFLHTTTIGDTKRVFIDEPRQLNSSLESYRFMPKRLTNGHESDYYRRHLTSTVETDNGVRRSAASCRQNSHVIERGQRLVRCDIDVFLRANRSQRLG